jgi:hypothetical protein
MSIQKLEKNYRDFLYFYEQEKKLDILEAKKLLNMLRHAGEYISSLDERDILSAWCRTIADIIYEANGEYLPVRIFQLEQTDSLETSFPIPYQIPPPPPDFTNRDKELDDILVFSFQNNMAIFLYQEPNLISCHL